MRITDVSKLKGPLGELNDQLFGENGEERLAEFNLWLKRVMTELLEFVRTVTVPAIGRFFGAEVWGRDGVNKNGVKIVFRGANFQAQFGSLVENNVGPVELTVNRLKEYATALDIASAIPQDKRAVKASQIYRLVRDQELTGQGPLLTNGWTNLFLAYGNDGNLWVVHVHRRSDGWRFGADPLGCPDGWRGGRHVFSRK